MVKQRMELDLKRAAFDCYEAAADGMLTQEESAETIVPDYCPDIARIIHTAGKIFISSRDLRDGKADISGTVKVTVLYTPDGEGGIRTLEFAMPFTVQGEARGTCLFAEAELESIETRLLNPRKVSTRCRILTKLSGYQKTQVAYCGDVDSGEGGWGIEKRQETRRATAITHILEKDFTFSDEMNISAGREAPEELLLSKVKSTVSETKLIGSKLILKGLFSVELLCRASGNQYYATAGELPFSQILEAVDAPEDAACRAEVQLTGAEFHLGGDSGDSHAVGVTLYLHVGAVLREEKSLTLLSDLYSTAYDLTYDAAPVRFSDFAETLSRRQTVREVLEIGVVAKSILSMDVVCGPVSVSREKETATLRTAVTVRALYLDEGDVPLVSERRLEVAGQLELPEDCQVSARACCGGEVQGSLTGGGIEVRFPVDFTAEAVSRRQSVCITGVKLDTEKPKDFTGQPSLVLRCLDKNETLWDLAKRYSTTGEHILAANEFACEEDICRDKLLLIPRKRA